MNESEHIEYTDGTIAILGEKAITIVLPKNYTGPKYVKWGIDDVVVSNNKNGPFAPLIRKPKGE